MRTLLCTISPPTPPPASPGPTSLKTPAPMGAPKEMEIFGPGYPPTATLAGAFCPPLPLPNSTDAPFAPLPPLTLGGARGTPPPLPRVARTTGG